MILAQLEIIKELYKDLFGISVLEKNNVELRSEMCIC